MNIETAAKEVVREWMAADAWPETKAEKKAIGKAMYALDAALDTAPQAVADALAQAQKDAQSWADAEFADAKSLGAGGPGELKRSAAAESKAKASIAALAALAAAPVQAQEPEHVPVRPDLFPQRDPSKPAEQQGVFQKFDVRRTDGSSGPGGKHHGCSYFVLDVDHDKLAKPALQAYAAACAATHPDLSADMVKRFDLAPVQPVAVRGGSHEAFEKCLYSFGQRVAQDVYKDLCGRTMDISCEQTRYVVKGVMADIVGKGLIEDLIAAAPSAQGDAKELTDDEIVQVLHLQGVDTNPSKFGFGVEQVSAMSVTTLRGVIAAIAAKAAS